MSEPNAVRGYVNDVGFYVGRADGLLTLGLRGGDPDKPDPGGLHMLVANAPESDLTIDGEKVDFRALVAWLSDPATPGAKVTLYPLPERYDLCLKAEFRTVGA